MEPKLFCSRICASQSDEQQTLLRAAHDELGRTLGSAKALREFSQRKPFESFRLSLLGFLDMFAPSKQVRVRATTRSTLTLHIHTPHSMLHTPRSTLHIAERAPSGPVFHSHSSMLPVHDRAASWRNWLRTWLRMSKAQAQVQVQARPWAHRMRRSLLLVMSAAAMAASRTANQG